MINDLPEGKTHYYGDSCIPPHVPPTNSTNELPKTEEEMLAKIKEASIQASEMQQELVDKLPVYDWGFWGQPPEPKEE